ncbi:MAG: ABC transporter ATP-binding protein, partial [Candidatus Cloacimonetes bacterium]|nr:ABC transporter ATP-binding protein [Candidatus Cloacimonadota bacterium]
MDTLKKIYRIALRYWQFFVASIVSMVLYTAFSGISITMIVPILDYVFVDIPKTVQYHTTGEFLSATGNILSKFFAEHNLFHLNKEALSSLGTSFKELCMQSDSMMLLWVISISFVLILFLKNVFFFLNRAFSLKLRGLTVYGIRNMLFHKYLFQSMAFYNENKTGDSLVRMISDIQIVSDKFIGSLLLILRDLMLVVMYAFIALAINPRLFLIVLIVMPGFAWLVGFVGKKLKKYAKKQQGQYSVMFSFMEEILSNMKIVKAFSREDYEMERFNKVNLKYNGFWLKSNLYTTLNVPISEIFSALIGATLLIIGGGLVLKVNSGFTLGNFMTFLFAIFSTMHPLKELTKSYSEIKKGFVSLERIGEIINQKSEIEEDPNPIHVNDFHESIVFEDTTFSYNGKDAVLKGINLTINKGEKVALVGNSGSGKTTLVNLLARLYDITSGDIKIDGTSIRRIAISDLRQLYGFVTQESILFNASVIENISYGSLHQLPDKTIIEAARIAYADEFIEKLPEKYNSLISPKASNLSGGQKQRLCIARAIAGNPPILIFDEATSALDTESEQKVQQAIENATANRTVVMIAHRLSTIFSADKIVVMDQGQIVGIGRHEEL